jgi:hypothetical protein
MFPLSFDYLVYKKNNVDLQNFNQYELIKHYRDFGEKEGRICSQVYDRQSFISLVPDSENTIEIGKLDKPVCRYAKNVDVFSREDLVKKYEHDPNVDVSKIEKVDYVIEGVRDWNIPEKFAHLVASHVIEHSPCIISFLRNIERTLHDDGLCFLVIPDHRYCFDSQKRPSNILDMLDAFYSEKKQPGLFNFLEHYLLSTNNNSPIFWQQGYVYKPSVYQTIPLAHIKEVMKSYNRNSYQDVHCWKLTPEIFSESVKMLQGMSLVNLQIVRIYPTIHNALEFYVILQKLKT